MTQAILTVLMPVYNGEKYLREAIDSILSQTFTDFEFLIINDGSTDKSEEIITSYTDKRIKYVKNNTNLKLIATLNKGIDLITTKYIARMDADDISMPNRLELQLNYMEAHPEVGVLGTWFESFNEQGCIGIAKYQTSDADIRFKQLYQIQISHGTVVLRTSILQKMKNYFNIEYVHAEDYELFTRMSHVTKLANVPEILLKVRKHELEVSHIYKQEQSDNSRRVKWRELKAIGLETLTEEQVDDFTALNYQNYKDIKSSCYTLQHFLEELVQKNNTSQVFEKSYLTQKIAKLWFSYCYEKHLAVSQYQSSMLAVQLSFSRYLKWIVKNILSKK